VSTVLFTSRSKNFNKRT